MKRTLLFANLILSAAIILNAQKTPESMLGAALHQEEVQGDLKGAIAAYQKVVTAPGVSRKTMAEALVHMAGCYQKMGDAESRKIYERVVRDYADQKEAAALARINLGGTNFAASAKGDRAVWTGPLVDAFGRVSPDGRFITFIDWNNGSLMAHDVAKNVDHLLTPREPKNNAWGESVFSRDGKQLIYAWSGGDNRRSLRIAEFQGSRILEPRQFFEANEDVRFMGPKDWSPDRKWIVATMQRKDGTGQIVLIAVADGSSRVLKSMDWNVPWSVLFSLDSKYIVYALRPTDTSQQRDVYALAIDGSRETPVIVHSADEEVLGWSPDGTRLLFSSDRTGSVGLWALPFADGKSQGTPELLRADIGSSIMPLGLTASGSLYLCKGIGSRDIKIAPIDLNVGKLTGPPASFTQGFLPGAVTPRWSPDSKYLAYVAGDGIAIRSVETGQVRQLTTLPYARGPHWSPDGLSFLTVGRDGKGRNGIFLIDVQTGALSPVIYTKGFSSAAWSHDGKKIYYVKDGGVVERDLASGAERDVIRRPHMWAEVNLSPDGRYLAVQTGAFALSTERTLLLVPVAGGEPRELMRLKDPDKWGRMGTTSWTPDGSAILKVKRTSSGTELLLIPIDETPVRKLDIDSDVWTRGAEEAGQDQGFSLSPDGRKIAFLMGKSASEVWALENFLPAVKTSK